MLFKFLKYLQPTHYFRLYKYSGTSVFPVVDEHISKQFPHDENYKSVIAKQYDQSWRAIQNGYIDCEKTIDEIKELSVYDNYVFARKYFSKIWVFYVLFLRVFNFKNPLKEISNFYRTRHVNRYLAGTETIKHSKYLDYNSQLLIAKPLISVIIPTLNRYQYLKDVLEDLEQQDYKNIEVIVIDQSEPFRRHFYDDFNLDLRVDYQEEKALWLARNKAIKQSKGDFILLFDDDSRVESDWITQHVKALDFFESDISSGISISKIGAEVPKHYAYFKISDQLDTGNVLIKKEIFNAIGLFDRQFEKQRMGDGEFGLRSFLNGYRNISNPYAKRLHLKVDSGGLRDMGSWDAFRTKNLLQPRPIPSVLYFYRSYFGVKNSVLAIIRTVPISIVPYKYKRNKPMLITSSILSLIVLPLIIFQVLRSWYLASLKLKVGPKIEML